MLPAISTAFGSSGISCSFGSIAFRTASGSAITTTFEALGGRISGRIQAGFNPASETAANRCSRLAASRESVWLISLRPRADPDGPSVWS